MFLIELACALTETQLIGLRLCFLFSRAFFRSGEVQERKSRSGAPPRSCFNNFSSRISLTVSSLAASAVIASKTTPQHIYKMAASGSIPSFRISGSVRFDPDEVASC